MLLDFMHPILTAISQVPASGPGNSGNAVPNSGAPGTAPSFPGLAGNNTPVTPAPGVAPQASPNVQSSPQPASIVLEDSAFYVLDSKDPDSKILGLQLKESNHRGRQVDKLQSDLHTSENENARLVQELQNAQTRLKNLDTEHAVAEQLSRLGVSTPTPQVAPPSAQQGVQSPYNSTPPQQGSYEAAWNFEEGTPGGNGMQQPQQTPVAQTQGAGLPDARNLAEQLLPVLTQIVRSELGNVPALVEQASTTKFQQLQQERSAQDRVQTTINASRQVRMEKLAKLSLEPDVINNILGQEDMAAFLNREAEALISNGGLENVTAAQEKLRQAAVLQDTAIEHRAKALNEFNAGERERVFESQLETAPYQALGIEEPQVNYELTNPRAIEAANKTALDAAIQMAEARKRSNTAVGR